MYDFLIIGGGVSGLSAAMYASRLGLKTIVIMEMPGGLITTAPLIENWPGIKSITGPDLAMAILEHATKSGAEFKNETVIKIEKKNDNTFKVKTTSNEYEAKTVLIATGTEHKKLKVPGEKELEGKGVSYCALCDGGFYKNKTICVVGGGDSAVREAVLLSEYAKKVYLIVRKDFLRAEPVNIKKIEQNPKIEILYKSAISEILGSDKVEKIKLDNGKELPMDGVFLAIGNDSKSDLAKDLGVNLNEKNEIIINCNGETNVKGVYAAGDCANIDFKQAITGSAQGVIAAYHAYRFL